MGIFVLEGFIVSGSFVEICSLARTNPTTVLENVMMFLL